MTAFVINLRPSIELTDEQFFQLCQANPEVRFERTAQGELIIMPPTGSGTGSRNFNLNTQLGIWTEQDGTGIGFGSSTGFKLPNGADRSPDAAWIERSRWDALSFEEQERFAPIAPDFVVELKSRTDNWQTLQARMQEYIDNGVRLGWLIDPIARIVEIYRSGQAVERLEAPETLSGENVLPGFVLNLQRIFI